MSSWLSLAIMIELEVVVITVVAMLLEMGFRLLAIGDVYY